MRGTILCPLMMGWMVGFLFLLFGVVAGAFSGLLGVGGGVLIVPFLIYRGYSPQWATGTSLAVIVFAALAGVLREWFSYRTIDWHAVLWLSLGAILGASLLGVPLKHWLPGPTLRKIFGALILLVALDMMEVINLKGMAAWLREFLGHLLS